MKEVNCWVMGQGTRHISSCNFGEVDAAEAQRLLEEFDASNNLDLGVIPDFQEECRVCIYKHGECYIFCWGTTAEFDLLECKAWEEFQRRTPRSSMWIDGGCFVHFPILPPEEDEDFWD